MIEIFRDEFATSPREDCENLGTLACYHKRYTLGDQDVPTKEEVKEIIESDNILFLDVFMYEHSGITVSTKPFACPWDSGQLGVIYVNKNKAAQECGLDKKDPEFEKKVYDYLADEVKTYDLFLTGQVYGYNITKPTEDEDEDVDSCYGYITADIEELIKEAKSIIDNIK